MQTIIGSFFVFMIVILLHELGHFAVAKWAGIKVNEFSIGMGPKILQKEVGETKYSLRALPIGGYVAMEGEESESSDPRSFNNVCVYKRMAVVVAGVIMNFILAVIAFMTIAIFLGIPTNKVGELVNGYPAQSSGLEVGDKIVEINGNKVSTWDEVLHNISKTKEKEDVDITVERNNKKINIEIKPTIKDGRAQIGISPMQEKSILGSISYGFKMTFDTIKDIFGMLGQLFHGKVKVKMLAGPIGVISIIGQATSYGFLNLIKILGIISANLAVLNILPIPALDGGKLVFLLIEAITGKKVNEKIEETLSLIGISLLFGLMIYVTIFGDLSRMFLGK